RSLNLAIAETLNRSIYKQPFATATESSRKGIWGKFTDPSLVPEKSAAKPQKWPSKTRRSSHAAALTSGCNITVALSPPLLDSGRRGGQIHLRSDLKGRENE
ncbi:hypothetical protein Tsubulata_040884, partial [Turnera subulata]